jgi:hypothetical protein
MYQQEMSFHVTHEADALEILEESVIGKALSSMCVLGRD